MLVSDTVVINTRQNSLSIFFIGFKEKDVNKNLVLSGLQTFFKSFSSCITLENEIIH